MAACRSAPGPPMTEKRKLAAILAADVVGFSRLTGSDEEGTLARLRTLWSDLIAPTIAVHNGRVVSVSVPAAWRQDHPHRAVLTGFALPLELS
jgi:class 3 adenylate cyclase